MPLFELGADGELLPFRRLHAQSGLYEKDIESVLWENLDELTGEPLFRVARQATVSGGGIPDIVALDHDGRVVIIEVKRDVDRGQIAQCLEYAGWARTTNLDDLSSLYHRGSDAFFRDWQEFTASSSPMVINRSPRLILVARGFHGRTGSALEFLVENGLPVQLVPVSVYEDKNGRRLVDIEAEYEPVVAPAPASESVQRNSDHTRLDGRRLRLLDLLDAGILQAGDTLVWERPRLGRRHEAVVGDNGSVIMPSGRAFSSPSRAAGEAEAAAGVTGAFDGWYAWRVPRLDNRLLNDLRRELVEQRVESEAAQ